MTGNSVDFGARIYDPRIGRWMSTNPLEHKYPALSPYVFCYDNPLNVIDPDGSEGIVILGQPGDHHHHHNNNNNNNNNKEYFLVNGLNRARAMNKQFLALVGKLRIHCRGCVIAYTDTNQG